MAWIELRKGKKGITYRITVPAGIGANGKPIFHRMNWKPDDGMTARQVEKALARAVADFERSIEQGYQLDQKKVFREYAQYVLELKRRTGVRPRTVERYEELLMRINAAIGHLKLTDIRPQHLNAFYAALSKEGVRLDGERAVAHDDLVNQLNQKRGTRADLMRITGLSGSTVTEVAKGQPVTRKTAETIARAMKKPVTELFDFRQNISPLSNKTILEYHRLISSILAQAEKEMLIPYNPAARATPPRVTRKEPDYYQPDEMDRILDALESVPLKWKTLIYLLIDTGCRRGEIAGLKWESIDMESGIVTIERALLYSPKNGVYEGPPKTGKSRTIKLAPETVALLDEHWNQQQLLQRQNKDIWVNTGYVFTQENGDRINPDSITDWLRKFSVANGLPHIHPHAFRHTAASTMIASGVDLVTTANELGHANATTTATIYAHQIATAKAKASEARSAVFRNRKKESAE